MQDEIIKRLVDKFLAWPLPKSVCSDLCVTVHDYKFPRSGTSLLTADEVEQMFKDIVYEEIVSLRNIAEVRTELLRKSLALLKNAQSDEREIVIDANGNPGFDGPMTVATKYDDVIAEIRQALAKG